MSVSSNNQGSERRQYFRIKNSLFMSYDVLVEGEPDSGPKELSTQSLRSMHLLKELNSMLEDNEIFATSLNEVENKSKAYAESLGKRITDITQYLVKTLGVEYSELLEVDLSGGGIRFETERPLEIGQELRLELVLVPEYYDLSTTGQIVDCQSLGASGLFQIAISFIDIHEADRDAIIRHVFKRQSQQLRSDKNE